jgi:hypothetical protein
VSIQKEQLKGAIYLHDSVTSGIVFLNIAFEGGRPILTLYNPTLQDSGRRIDLDIQTLTQLEKFLSEECDMFEITGQSIDPMNVNIYTSIRLVKKNPKHFVLNVLENGQCNPAVSASMTLEAFRVMIEKIRLGEVVKIPTFS